MTRLNNIRLILFFILVINFFLRLSHFDYPLAFGWGDGARDYLVAHHIRMFHEFPLVGPFNPLYEYGVRNSPIYYYLLSFFLLPHDSILTLGIINIFFQIANIVLIYIIAKNLFNKRVAIIASVFFGFAPRIISQAEFIWQPYLMQTFSYISFYFLLIAYRTKKYRFMIASIIVLMFAGALHNTAYILLPELVLLLFVLLKKQKAPVMKYVGIVLSTFIGFVVFYLPSLFYLVQNPVVFSWPTKLSATSQYIENVLSNTGEVFGTFFPLNTVSLFPLGSLLLFTSMGVLLAYFFLYTNESEKKRSTFLILIACLQVVLTISFFDPAYKHYLILISGLLIIALAGIIYTVFTTQKMLRVVCFIIFALLFTNMFSKASFFRERPLSKQVVINEASDSLKQELLGLQKKEGYQDLRFFRVKSYILHGQIIRLPRLDAVFLVTLEEKLGKKFVTVDSGIENFHQTNGSSYVVLVCYNFDYAEDGSSCVGTFTHENPNYKIIKNIYSHFPLSLRLTKRL